MIFGLVPKRLQEFEKEREMTKQDEIREWFAQRHCNNCMTDEQCRDKRGGGRCKDYYEGADEELQYLDSQGVVVKVEMPEVASDWIQVCGGGINIIIPKGYCATEPLIKQLETDPVKSDGCYKVGGTMEPADTEWLE